MSYRAKIILLGMFVLLAGCSARESTEDKIGRLFVAPGKFSAYSCAQLEIRANGSMARRKQLEQLMAKAGSTPDGRMVSLLAYQSDYTETGADLAELRRAAAEKECKPIASLKPAGPVR